jgi:xanthosine utilization system XapX-like protein
MFLFMWTSQVPSIPAAMALAAVALIGYLVGRQSRPAAVRSESAEKISRALADARHLEQITDEVLSVTREALDQCRKLRIHCQPPLTVPRATAEHVSA